MQIRNDYHSQSGLGYRNSHTHHITKSLHEEGQKQQDPPAAGAKNSGSHQEAQKGTFSREQASAAYGEAGPKQAESPVEKRGKGIFGKYGSFSKMWEALGKEEQGEESARAAAGANTAPFGIRQLLPAYFVNKWVSIKEKIKRAAGAAQKRIKKQKDAFSALTDKREHSTGKKGREKQLSQKENKVLRRGNVEIISAEPIDGHLMDSYNKTGQYCKLNENLTYRKKV